MKKTLILTITLAPLFIACSTKEVCKQPGVLDLSNKTMSFIKGGDFFMGDYNDTFGDKTPKEVAVSSYYIDKTEVTNGIYRAYLEERCDVRRPKYIDDPVLGADELPVVDITYYEAKEFCEHYSKRLPTEAEWEYAARGNLEIKRFPWGDEQNTSFMNYRDSNIKWSTPSMTYMPNNYEIYDMSGNVREWVEDTYEKDFYKRSCLLSPINIKAPIKTLNIKKLYKSNCYLDPLNESEGKFKVNRGGSWSYAEGYPATVSFRFFDEPDNSFNDLGFRCAHGADKELWMVKKFKENYQKVEELLGTGK